MFVSFFPAPRPFFWSAAIWALAMVLFWYFGGRNLGEYLGLGGPPASHDRFFTGPPGNERPGGEPRIDILTARRALRESPRFAARSDLDLTRSCR